MLTLKDCADFCDLSEDELTAIQCVTHLPFVEACALVESMGNTPAGCRQLLQLMHQYLEHIEAQSDEQKSHEVHKAINRFVANHHFV